MDDEQEKSSARRNTVKASRNFRGRGFGHSSRSNPTASQVHRSILIIYGLVSHRYIRVPVPIKPRFRALRSIRKLLETFPDGEAYYVSLTFPNVSVSHYQKFTIINLTPSEFWSYEVFRCSGSFS